jgi:hypothetical protein
MNYFELAVHYVLFFFLHVQTRQKKCFGLTSLGSHNPKVHPYEKRSTRHDLTRIWTLRAKPDKNLGPWGPNLTWINLF